MGLCDGSCARNGKRGASVQAQGDPRSVSIELFGAITYFPLPVVLHLWPENPVPSGIQVKGMEWSIR